MNSLSHLSASVVATTDAYALDDVFTRHEFPENAIYNEYILTRLALGIYENSMRQIGDGLQTDQQNTFVDVCRNIIFKHFNTLDISYYQALPSLRDFEDMFKNDNGKYIDTSNITCFRAHHNESFTFHYLRIILRQCPNLEIIDIYGCPLISRPRDIIILEEIDNMFCSLLKLKRFRLQHYRSNYEPNIMYRITRCLLFRASKQNTTLESVCLDACGPNPNVIFPIYGNQNAYLTDYSHIVNLSLRNMGLPLQIRDIVELIPTLMVNLVYLDMSVHKNKNVSLSLSLTKLFDLPKLKKLCVNGWALDADSTLILNEQQFKKLELFANTTTSNAIDRIINKYLKSHKLTCFQYIQTYLRDKKYWMENMYLDYAYKLPFKRLNITEKKYEYFNVMDIEEQIEYYSRLTETEDDLIDEENFIEPSRYDRQLQKLFHLFYSFCRNPMIRVCDENLHQKLEKITHTVAKWGYRYRGLGEYMNILTELGDVVYERAFDKVKHMRLLSLYHALHNALSEILNKSIVDNVEVFTQHYKHGQNISIINTCRLLRQYISSFRNSVEFYRPQVIACGTNLRNMAELIIQLLLTYDMNVGINDRDIKIQVTTAINEMVTLLQHYHSERLATLVNVLMITASVYGIVHESQLVEYRSSPFYQDNVLTDYAVKQIKDYFKTQQYNIDGTRTIVLDKSMFYRNYYDNNKLKIAERITPENIVKGNTLYIGLLEGVLNVISNRWYIE